MRSDLSEKGWVVACRRHIGGSGDVLAVKPGYSPRLIEVKTDAAGPWAHYGPKERREHLDYCHKHDLEPVMAWVRGKTIRLLFEDDWPSTP